MDARSPRDGRVIEELGHYDPMVGDTDARAVLDGERIDYWLSVGAQPSEKVKVLIRKYGSQGTHLEQQRQALERLKQRPQAPPPQPLRVAPKASEPVAAEVSESGDE
jgi:small subunit ribosomal protein S16